MSDTKICTKCNQEKDVDKFNADSRRADGKRASCKECDAEIKKQIRNANLTEYRARNRENNKRFRDRQRGTNGSV